MAKKMCNRKLRGYLIKLVGILILFFALTIVLILLVTWFVLQGSDDEGSNSMRHFVASVSGVVIFGSVGLGGLVSGHRISKENVLRRLASLVVGALGLFLAVAFVIEGMENAREQLA